MGIGWRDMEIPKKLECDESTAADTYAKFVAEPFERGFGTTVGNSLRRVLLSSIEGTAVTSVKIEGVQHEFSTIPGVQEDVPEIILNIKQLILKSHFKSPKTIYIKVEKKGEVSAKDIITDETIQVLNPDLHIATLTKKVKLSVEMEVGRGRGYVQSEKNRKEDQPIGTVAIDSVFSPVSRVNYHVENTRVGQITDYEKLIVEIWTNGGISPKEAMLHASHILSKHLEIFMNFGKLVEEETSVDETADEKLLYEKLIQPVSDLELSVRSSNCLKEAGIKYIGDLVRKTEMDMLKYRNFGKKSLSEINEVLTGMGLGLNTKIDAKKFKDFIVESKKEKK